jgi:hypothetical protein
MCIPKLVPTSTAADGVESIPSENLSSTTSNWR